MPSSGTARVDKNIQDCQNTVQQKKDERDKHISKLNRKLLESRLAEYETGKAGNANTAETSGMIENCEWAIRRNAETLDHAMWLKGFKSGHKGDVSWV